MQLLEVKTYKLERIAINEEFSALVQPLDPKEMAQLEENIRRDGIREPLSIWTADGSTPTLLDGHNRRAIALAMGLTEVPVHFIKLPDRDAALLWIEECQAGRRNLTDDQRAMIWASILTRRTKVSRSAQLEQARQAKSDPASVGAKIAPTEKTDALAIYTPPSAETALAPAPGKLSPLSPRDKRLVIEGIRIGKQREREKIAAESGLSESKLRAAAKLKKEDPAAAEEVRTGKKTLRQIRKEAHAARVQATDDKRRGKSEAWRVRQIDSLVGRLYGVLPYDQRNQEIFRMLQHTFDSFLSPDYKLPDGAPEHIEGYSNAKDDHTAPVKSVGAVPAPESPATESTAVLIQCRQEALTYRRDASEDWENASNSYEDLVEKGAAAEVIDEAKLVMDDAERTWSNADSAFLALDSALRRAGIVGLSKPAPVESVDATEPLIEVLP